MKLMNFVHTPALNSLVGNRLPNQKNQINMRFSQTQPCHRISQVNKMADQSADHTTGLMTIPRFGQALRILLLRQPAALPLHSLLQLQLRLGGVELSLEHPFRVQVRLVEQKVEGVRTDRLL
jgi:hypothetical protein